MTAVEDVDSGAVLPAAHRTRSKAKASSSEPLNKGKTLKKAALSRATAGRKKTTAKPDKKLPSRQGSDETIGGDTPLTSIDW